MSVTTNRPSTVTLSRGIRPQELGMALQANLAAQRDKATAPVYSRVALQNGRSARSGETHLRRVLRSYAAIQGRDRTIRLRPFGLRRDELPFGKSFGYGKTELGGAQGRDRTTDTAIFSRMLYQLSYLGMPRGRKPKRAGGL